MKSFLVCGGLVMASFLLVSCGSKTETQGEVKEIIGKDNRIAGKHPAVGVLKFKSVVHCNATLIEKDIIVTAKHCLSNEFNKDTLTFEDSIGNSSSIKEILDSKGHFVKIRLEKSLGKKIEISKPQKGFITLYSWSFDKKEYMMQGEFLDSNSIKSSYFTYGLDSTKGNSGAPIFQGDKLIGIHLGYSESLKLNMASYLEEELPQDLPTDLKDEWGCNSNCDWHQVDCHAYVTACSTWVHGVCMPVFNDKVKKGAEHNLNRPIKKLTETQINNLMKIPGAFNRDILNSTRIIYNSTGLYAAGMVFKFGETPYIFMEKDENDYKDGNAHLAHEARHAMQAWGKEWDKVYCRSLYESIGAFALPVSASLAVGILKDKRASVERDANEAEEAYRIHVNGNPKACTPGAVIDNGITYNEYDRGDGCVFTKWTHNKKVCKNNAYAVPYWSDESTSGRNFTRGCSDPR